MADTFVIRLGASDTHGTRKMAGGFYFTSPTFPLRKVHSAVSFSSKKQNTPFV